MATPTDREDAADVTRFAVAVTALSGAFWVLGALEDAEVLVPGLPVSAGMFLAPAVAALLVGRRTTGRRSRRRSDLDGSRPGTVAGLGWVAVMPALMALAYGYLSATDSIPSPDLTWTRLVVLAAVFLVTAACEEFGWTRFLAPRLLDRHGVVGLGVLLGLCWSGLHVIPYLQADRPLAWVVWQCAFSVAFRVLILASWILGRQSMWPPIALHASFNVAWGAFPVDGSYYDPAVMAVLVVVPAAVAARAAGSGVSRRPAAGRRRT